MTAAEKAISLISIFKHKVSGSMPDNLAHNHAKQCALISVEQTIDTFDKLWNKYSCDCLGFEVTHWQQVKTELLNL